MAIVILGEIGPQAKDAIHCLQSEVEEIRTAAALVNQVLNH